MSKPMRRPPKYMQSFVDGTGKACHYLRKPGLTRTPLPGLPWSPEFMAAYAAALQGETKTIGTSKPGSVEALVASYYRTADFAGLRATTKATYRGIIERFREEHGDKRVVQMETRHVRKIIGDKATTPSAANNLLRMMHLLMRHAVELGWRKDDPTEGVRKIKVTGDGFATWGEEHIDQFLAHHGEGTRARLALLLLLYTGQRRSDVVRMGRQHVRDGTMSITQTKTGTTVHVPVFKALRDALDALPPGQFKFLLTTHGKPFSPAGFGNWFREVIDEADLPKGLSSHGLRKATARRLAECGQAAHAIMAVLGHSGLAEAARYTKAAHRKRMAAEGMAALERIETGTKSVKSPQAI